MPASTQRPFFGFLAAFRPASLTTNTLSQPTSKTPSHSHTHSHSQNPSTSASQPREIHSNASATKHTTGNNSSAISRTHASSLNSSPEGSPGSGGSFTNNSNGTSAAQRYLGSGAGNMGSANKSINTGFRTSVDRRGSDSSSEGFREIMGREKWYIGGRTLGGEERYFPLGVVRRRRSGGEMSLDRLSL